MKRLIAAALLALTFISAARAEITLDTDPERIALLQYVGADATMRSYLERSYAARFGKTGGTIYASTEPVAILASVEQDGTKTAVRYKRRSGLVFNLRSMIPVLNRLASEGNADDQFVLAVLKARMAMHIGQLDVAADLLEGAMAAAVSRGAEDVNMVSAMADLAEIERLRGNRARALNYFIRASVCKFECPSDIVFSVLEDVNFVRSRSQLWERFGKKEAVPFVASLVKAFRQRRADQEEIKRADISAWLGEFLTIDPLLQIALERRGEPTKGPISEAWADEELVARLTPLKGVEIKNFIDIVNDALVSNIVAGRYQAAIAITEATFGKFEVHTVEPKTWYRFQRFYGRALFRARDPRTREHYAWLVDNLIKGNWVTKGYEPFEEADKILLDLFDTPDLDTIRRLLEPMIGQQNVFRLHALNARLHSREGDNAKAAEIMAFLRKAPAMQEMKPERQLAYRAQHAAYLRLAGEDDQANALMADVSAVSFEIPTASDVKLTSWASFGEIQLPMELRERGLYEGAAHIMAAELPKVPALEAKGTYTDAQVLWQMAFTFARAGQQALAFDLMDRAARIASRISFETAGQDGLELLERDRQRYLLFVDIAWGAATGQRPQNMSVLSRY
ncbi:MAG: hypothetical protein AAGF29_05870 [Pseudomonadota bacterium]